MDAVSGLERKRLVLRKMKMSARLLRSSAGHLLLPVANTSSDEPEDTPALPPTAGGWPTQAVRTGSAKPDAPSPESTKETPRPEPSAPRASRADASRRTVFPEPPMSPFLDTSSPRPLQCEWCLRLSALDTGDAVDPPSLPHTCEPEPPADSRTHAMGDAIRATRRRHMHGIRRRAIAARIILEK